ncbi:MAG: alpha/beta hydrolase [Deltaproteobacteria bacterium]|jgi:alpha/beta superfamily hydrolase|nr:MAG: alpha/beta hydrolase [Deltaproteobacteria bacterium]
MKEEKIRFHSKGLLIEGLLCVREGERGVVVTHPHPLYGGTMYDQIVEALVTIYQGKGFSTLRFNFRGVGDSEGGYDQGKGEKEDVISALRYMYDRGKRDLDLAGYSFGAWVNAKVTDTESMPSSMIMISPPVTFLDFSFLSFNPKIEAVVTGGEDDIAPADKIRSLVFTWNPGARFEVIEGADHFYSGMIDALKSLLCHLID